MGSAGRIVLAVVGLLLLLAATRGCPEAEEDNLAPAPPAAQPAPAENATDRPDAPPSAQGDAAPTKAAAQTASPQWDRPRFAEQAGPRNEMVRYQIANRGVKDAAVLDAMRNVPRHLFVPPNQRRAAYADQPLPIGYGQTISQPYIVALMTELLEIKPGHAVLEIGTGSGYQAAILSELTPHVFTIEILDALYSDATTRLRELGYATIQTRHADGYYGWPEAGPFDAIIVTAAAGHVPPPLIAQLKPGGRMAIPVGPVYETQQLLLITKDERGQMRSRSVLPVRFVPVTGRALEVQREADGR